MLVRCRLQLVQLASTVVICLVFYMSAILRCFTAMVSLTGGIQRGAGCGDGGWREEGGDDPVLQR